MKYIIYNNTPLQIYFQNKDPLPHRVDLYIFTNDYCYLVTVITSLNSASCARTVTRRVVVLYETK